MVRKTQRRVRRGRRNISKKTRGGMHLLPSYKKTRIIHYKEYAEALVEYIYKGNVGFLDNNLSIDHFKLKLLQDFFSVVKEVKSKKVDFLSSQNNLSSYLSQMISLAEKEDATLARYLTEAKDFVSMYPEVSDSPEVKIMKELSKYNFHFGEPTFLKYLKEKILEKKEEISEQLSDEEEKNKSFTKKLLSILY